MICNKCHNNKNIYDFYKNNRICKECCRLKSIEYYKNNINSIKEKQKEYRESNRQKINLESKLYRKNNLIKVKQSQKTWYENNKDHHKLHQADYRKKYPDKVKETLKKSKSKNRDKIKLTRNKYFEKNRLMLNKYAVNRRNSNPIFKLSHNVRGRIRQFLKSKNMFKNNKTFNIVGCSPEELKNHLEQQFSKGMNWGNYGYYGWHVDHKIPLDTGKTEDEILKLCHYGNLQPMWWNENLSKNNKII